MYNLETLKSEVSAGKEFKYILFWGGIYSQWYPSPFTIDGIEYPTAEHFMMAKKAELFQDTESLEKIMKTSDPAEAKAIGRKVVGYNDYNWNKIREDVVIQGNKEKFLQNPELRKQLFDSGEDILVEASPYDKIWGIGLSEDDHRASDPLNWRGLNLLGFCIMHVRGMLRG